MTAALLNLIGEHPDVGDQGQRPGIALVSPTGHVNLANAAFWSMLGQNSRRAAIDQFILPEDRNGFLTVMSDLAQGAAGPFQLLLRFALPDGSVLRSRTLVSIVRVNGVLEQFIIQLTPACGQDAARPIDQQFSNVTAFRPVSFHPDS